MREKIIRFMQGRYGADGLNRFMVYLCFIIIIVNMFVKSRVLSIIESLILILAIVRMLSRNYSARAREGQKYEEIKSKILGKFGRNGGSRGNSRYQQYQRDAYQRQQAQNAGYKIFKCSKCGQKIRVPSGKGKIEISCPKCQNRFIKKS